MTVAVVEAVVVVEAAVRAGGGVGRGGGPAPALHLLPRLLLQLPHPDVSRLVPRLTTNSQGALSLQKGLNERTRPERTGWERTG